MKVLLDTNIIIHRETSQIVNKQIGILFNWFHRGHYELYVHPVTIQEINNHKDQIVVSTFNIKLDSYQHIISKIPLAEEVKAISDELDIDENDRNDSELLNEVFCGRVDFFISEDNKVHKKSKLLNINDKVYKINSFLDKVRSENPKLIDYKVLSVEKKMFSEINVDDKFFDNFKQDYSGFIKWFLKKSDEIAYVSFYKEKLLAFLYLKIEKFGEENYSDINPTFIPKKRLKIGTFKVIDPGLRLSERFIKIIFDNALKQKVDEIYVTIFNNSLEKKMLINLLEEWGFYNYGIKESVDGQELVYVRNFKPSFNQENPRKTYPYFTSLTNIFLIPIYPEYHTELLPDSILTTESEKDFKEDKPHRNAIKKVYISRSIERNIKKGDILIFYRTATSNHPAHYTAVITTIGIVEEKIEHIKDLEEFIIKCRKRSIFDDEELGNHWNRNPHYRPFIINFLYIHSFQLGKRINRARLLELGILTGQENEIRGLKRITRDHFNLIIKETETDESLIIN